MLSLARKEQETVKFEGRGYSLRLSFDRVLLFYELLDDPRAEDHDKLKIGLDLFVKGRRWEALPPNKQMQLLELIFNQHIKSNRPQGVKKPKAMDYLEDADYLFSSFWLAYGMDLQAQRGKLSWSRFAALLDGLPDYSKMREVIKIRTMEIPAPDKYNAKERASIIESKQYYALKSANMMDYQTGLEALFGMAKSMALKG